MYCAKCGTEAEEGQKFCIYCGANLDESNQYNSLNSRTPSALKLFFIAAVILIGIGVMVGFSLERDSQYASNNYYDEESREDNERISSTQGTARVMPEKKIYYWGWNAGKYEWYDFSGRLIATEEEQGFDTTVDPTGEVSIFTYDEQGYQQTFERYDKQGKLAFYTFISWNSSHSEAVSEFYDSYGALGTGNLTPSGKAVYQFFDDGSLKEQWHYAVDGTLVFHSEHNKGEWIDVCNEYACSGGVLLE